MARKTCDFVATEGRDKGKNFRITEMSAAQAEAWAARAILALLGNNAELPDGSDSSFATIAEIGLKALSGLQWPVLEPLLAEMMDCVQVVPDRTKQYLTRPLIEEDVEEVATRLQLRAEVWKLHTDFLGLGDRLQSLVAARQNVSDT